MPVLKIGSGPCLSKDKNQSDCLHANLQIEFDKKINIYGTQMTGVVLDPRTKLTFFESDEKDSKKESIKNSSDKKITEVVLTLILE